MFVQCLKCNKNKISTLNNPSLDNPLKQHKPAQSYFNSKQPTTFTPQCMFIKLKILKTDFQAALSSLSSCLANHNLPTLREVSVVMYLQFAKLYYKDIYNFIPPLTDVYFQTNNFPYLQITIHIQRPLPYNSRYFPRLDYISTLT